MLPLTALTYYLPPYSSHTSKHKILRSLFFVVLVDTSQSSYQTDILGYVRTCAVHTKQHNICARDHFHIFLRKYTRVEVFFHFTFFYDSKKVGPK